MSDVAVKPAPCARCGGDGFDDPAGCAPCRVCGGARVTLEPMSATDHARARAGRMRSLLEALRAYRATYLDPMLEPGEEALQARAAAREALFAALEQVGS